MQLVVTPSFCRQWASQFASIITDASINTVTTFNTKGAWLWWSSTDSLGTRRMFPVGREAHGACTKI
eukprot:4119542-Amphidinium_carterae.1